MADARAPFERKYSDAQRDSVTAAWLDAGIRPLARVLELGATGNLRHEGSDVEPFTMPIATARQLIAQERKRRAGRVDSALVNAAPQSQAEIVRRRLMAIVESELAACEKQMRAHRRPDLQRASHAAKLAREALALKTGSVLDRPTAEPSPATQDRESQPPRLAQQALRRLTATGAPGETQRDAQTDAQNAPVSNLEPSSSDAQLGDETGAQDGAQDAQMPGSHDGAHVAGPIARVVELTQRRA